jgi:ABC-type transport system involved in multi-copper enzyme maturation permease subunit
MSRPARLSDPLDARRRPEPRGLSGPAVALLLASPILLLIGLVALFFLTVYWQIAVLIAGAELAILLVLAGKGGVPGGPLVFYDVVRLARRGRTTLLRSIYALLLLAGLGLVYADRFWRDNLQARLIAEWEGLDPNALARLGMAFFQALVAVQTLAVFVLTPAYLAGAFGEERERGTLELLFTTHLHAGEIVAGKLLGRLIHVGGILLTGLPVLFLIQFWGGVDAGVVVAVAVATAFTLLSVGSISICCSALRLTRLGAILTTYGVILLLIIFSSCCPFSYGLSSPFTFFFEAEQRMYGEDLFGDLTFFLGPTPVVPGPEVLLPLTGRYALCHGFVAVICLALASSRLRRIPASARLAEQADLKGKGFPLMARPQRSVVPTPLIGDQALLWKELHFATRPGGDSVRQVLLVLIFALVVSAIMLLGVSLSMMAVEGRIRAELFEAGNVIARGLVLMLLGVLCVGTGLQAAGSVARERERHTLDGLLTLPLEREEILRAKWRGSLCWGQPFLYILAVLGAVGVISGVLHPVAVILLALAGRVHVWFFCTLGLWLSVICRTTMRATLGLALLLLLVTAGPWLVLTFSETFGTRVTVAPWVSGLLGAGLDPLGAWWQLGFPWRELPVQSGLQGRQGEVVLMAVLIGLVLYSFAERVLWRAACRALRREQRPG